MCSRIILLILIIFTITLKSYATEKTELVIISSMHGAHKNHPGYDYQTLYDLVHLYKPDFVGVEIRQEDIKSDADYLRSNYPKEMVELAIQYKANVFGFDWLGDEIKGKQIPKDYWSNLAVKKLSKAMNEDHEFLNSKPKQLDRLSDMQSRIIEQATPYSLNNGDYGRICREIDKIEEEWLNGSRYIEIIEFDRKRDLIIGGNIIEFIEQHKGKRIVLVMGADHRTFAIENIRNKFGNEVELVPIKKSIKNFEQSGN